MIINPIYIVTDDKSLTYLAKHIDNRFLENFYASDFLFTKAFNEEELIEKIKYKDRSINHGRISEDGL